MYFATVQLRLSKRISAPKPFENIKVTFENCVYKRIERKGHHSLFFHLNTMLGLVIILVLVETFGCTEIEVSNTSSPVLFTLVGQAALKTAYGHLIVPLNLPSLKASFDQFDDLEKAIN